MKKFRGFSQICSKYAKSGEFHPLTKQVVGEGDTPSSIKKPLFIDFENYYEFLGKLLYSFEVKFNLYCENSRKEKSFLSKR